MLHYHLTMCTKDCKKERPEIKKSLSKEMFWSNSFCLIGSGSINDDIIKQYIQTQGKKEEINNG